MAEEDKDKQIANVDRQPSGSTLLPAPIANIVSLATRSSSIYIRLGTFIGGLALDGARVTTLTGLELSRAVIESILHRAGSDVATRSTGELGRAEAESLLERSIATLHSTITSISFAASAGFQISTLALESATDLSQQLLGTLDSMLGSTDSSRAIASIITLIRREFQNPATGKEGEKVGVADLLIGICGLALLQRWCRKLTEFENSEKRYDEVIWDVVVLDDGRRVDVFGEVPDAERVLMNSLTYTTPSNDVLETIQREDRSDHSDEDILEVNLKQKILQTLPADAYVSITTSTSTTKTITVEITGTKPLRVSPPPGVELVEEYAHHSDNSDLDDDLISTNAPKTELSSPKQRVVYQITRNNVADTNLEAGADTNNGGKISDDVDVDVEKDIVDPSIPIPGSNFELTPLSSPETDDIETPLTFRERPSQTVSTADSPEPMEFEDEKLPMSPVAPITLEHAANQKRSRQPLSSTPSSSGSESQRRKSSGSKYSAPKKAKSDKPHTSPVEDKSSFRKALRKGPGNTLSNLWNKDSTTSAPSYSKKTSTRPPWGSQAPPANPNITTSPRETGVGRAQEVSRVPLLGNPNFFSSKDLGVTNELPPRSPSRASYYSVHEQRRNSIVSQTDTYSVHSANGRPVSPNALRNHIKAQSSLIRARSDKDIAKRASSFKNHRRSGSYVPSIYTLNANNSATSLVVAAAQGRRSAFEDGKSIEGLLQTGHVDGLFPQHHIVRNLTRFIRFASASYGASFLRVMGIADYGTGKSKEFDTIHHHEHHSFSNHTQLPPSTILLSSFVDPQGGTDFTGHTGTGIPMVHFVSLDHDSKAVVLTCRGTLGFEDILTDLTCDFDEITYRSRRYKVHMGIHASARRLLSSRVLITIRAALEEFPDYGLVLCGHSLGGSVVSLLSIMISEPCTYGTAFVTSSVPYERSQLLLASSTNPGLTSARISHLPPGRPIHVYAYGPPATLSPSLRLATRGLITTVVNGQDLVPYLSLGTVHDLQAVALAFKADDSGAKGEVRKRVWEGLRGSFQDKWYRNSAASQSQSEEDDQWAYATLKTLRSSMLSSKLVPPGEVFIVESMPVLRRDGFVKEGQALGRPATRSVLRYVRDVEKRFGEVKFGGSMLLDHSPGRYEASLRALGKGVLNSR